MSRSRFAIVLLTLVASHALIGCGSSAPATAPQSDAALKADEAEKGRANGDMPGGGPPAK